MSANYLISNGADYWIRKDKDDYIKSLFKLYSLSFPKIKKEDGFVSLKSIDISCAPWPLYVMVLSKTLILDSRPRFPYEIESNLSDTEITCDICSITFINNIKDEKSYIREVLGLYKLYKSINHMTKYPLCLACFYALQNPSVALDYPKNNRKDPMSKDDYYTNTFCMLKRNSDFGYLGEMIRTTSDDILSYVVKDIAMIFDGEHLPDKLNIDEFAR